MILAKFDDVTYLEKIQAAFEAHQQSVVFVELETSLEERLRRNCSEERLIHKPLKRHVSISEAEIVETATSCQFNTIQSPKDLHHYLKIDNTERSAEEVAQWITDYLLKL
ncbi:MULTISPECIES: hypothetical protein [unclassified Streptococcus]|uniref:hypothetical protein n=1 Tax=unclassified Streptococcus TaxID=2608887 RepID=UPI000AC8CA0B|nr:MULTISPECIES: hypothetical protein [unclassified Streptococcus]